MKILLGIKPTKVAQKILIGHISFENVADNCK